MHLEGRINTEIQSITGMRLRTVTKYLEIGEDQISEPRKTICEKEHEEVIQKAQAKVDWVKKLNAEGFSKDAIAKKTGFAVATVFGYLSHDFTPISVHYGKLREGKLVPFQNMTLVMHLEGVTYQKIYEHINALGYTGSVAAIWAFVTKDRRINADLEENNGNQGVELIDRKWTIKLLYHPLEKVKGITKAQYKAVIETYPKAATVYHVIEQSRYAINAKEIKHLTNWIEGARAIGIYEFDSFIRRIEQEIDAARILLLLLITTARQKDVLTN